MSSAIGIGIEPRSQRLGDWGYEDEPPLIRVGDSDMVFKDPQRINVDFKPVRLLTVSFECSFCHMANEVVIDGYSMITKDCAHCDAVHFIRGDESPPSVKTCVRDGGTMDAEVIIPIVPGRKPGRKS